MAAAAVAGPGFAGSKTDNAIGDNELRPKTIESVLKEHTEELMSIPGVVGTAQGLCGDEPCIKVFVIEKTPALVQQVPEIIEGFQVEMEETGEVRAYPKKEPNH